MNRIILALALALCATLVGAQSVVPTIMNYQGRLTKPDGTPVQDGNYKIVFKLFDTPTGASNLVWSETLNSVVLKNGVFAVMLGATFPLSAQALSGPRFLEIQLNDDPPLKPRQQVASVAYSFHAESAGNGVPVGGVISWWGDSAKVPDGWKVCDGSAVADTASPLNGLSTPNLLDKFIRGATGNVRANTPTGGSDAINLAHSHTVDAHTHSVPAHAHEMFHAGGNEGDWFTYAGQQIAAGRDQQEVPPSGHKYLFATTVPAGYYYTGPSGPFDSTPASPGTNSALSAAQSIVPSYVGLVYIIRTR